MSKQTTLAESQITQSPHDVVTVELVEPDELPPVVRIRWPQQPTITTPASYDGIAANVMRILANAVIELAAIKVWKKL